MGLMLVIHTSMTRPCSATPQRTIGAYTLTGRPDRIQAIVPGARDGGVGPQARDTATAGGEAPGVTPSVESRGGAGDHYSDPVWMIWSFGFAISASS